MISGNVLVTGGAGFVGSNIIKRLFDNDQINITATIHDSVPQIINGRVKYIHADLTNKTDCDRVVKDIDYVFMCAANTSGANVIEKTPLCHVTPNVLMNTLMLESAYAAGVKKFLFISSSTVYPVTNFLVKETDVTGEMFDKYFCVGWMKRFSEIMCEMYSTKVKPPMQTVVIRPGNIYGEYDDFDWETSHVIPSLMRKVVEKHNPLIVWGDGKDIKNFIYIQDFVDGVMQAMESNENISPLNIAADQHYSVREVLDIMLDIESSDVRVEFDSSKPTMIPVRLMDTSKASSKIGFKSKVSMRDGLKRTMEWYKKYGLQ